MGILVYLLGISLVVYLLILAAVKLFADYLIFPVPNPSYKPEDCAFFASKDGIKLAAKYFDVKDSKYCIIYAHGNGEDLGMITPLLQRFANFGISVFAYDYPGYGRSLGRPNKPNYLLAAEAAVDYVENTLEYGPENIVAIGYSLGGAAAVRMSEYNPKLRAMILIGAFANAQLAVLPVDIIPWSILENRNGIAKFKNPVLFLHGRRDSIVPARNAEKNFAVANNPKRIVWFEGLGHYNLSDEKAYWKEIFNLINLGSESFRSNENEKSIGSDIQ